MKRTSMSYSRHTPTLFIYELTNFYPPQCPSINLHISIIKYNHIYEFFSHKNADDSKMLTIQKC